MALPNSQTYILQTLIDGVTFNDAMTNYISGAIECFPWHHYSLFIAARSAGVDGHFLTIDIEFSPDDGATWYKYAGSVNDRGSYSVFTISNSDASDRLLKCIVGEWSATNQFRLNVTATNTTARKTFVLTVKAQFWR